MGKIDEYGGDNLMSVKRSMFYIIYAAGIGVLLSWWQLTDSICTSPVEVNANTNNVVPYNCHGKTTFITPLQERGRLFIPGFGLLLVLSAYYLRKRNAQ